MKRQRSRKAIQADINATIEQRERFAQLARETEDKDDKAGLYGNVDRCNQRIRELVIERDTQPVSVRRRR